jgi:hypothetical protein
LAILAGLNFGEVADALSFKNTDTRIRNNPITNNELPMSPNNQLITESDIFPPGAEWNSHTFEVYIMQAQFPTNK